MNLPIWIPPAANVIPALISAGVLGFAFPSWRKWLWIIPGSLAGLGLIGAGYLYLEESARPVFLSVLAANVLGISAFLYGLKRFKSASLASWLRRLEDMEKSVKREEKTGILLRKESDALEDETARSVRTYRVVKGLGEALNWEEMAPHMDYAVQHCMGFRDYCLYLMDDNTSLQKILFRGAKMAEAPSTGNSASSQWHVKGNETYLELPIRRAGNLIALLWMRISPYMAEQLKETLQTQAEEISEELVMGLEKARLFSSLERLSRMDGLTGVHRRKVFDDRINEEIRRSKAFRTNFSILMCDLDHFKAINDTYGHQAGDEVLRRMGRVLQESVYETDFVARYGGEEFVIIFPQADPKGVQKKAETIRGRIEAEKFTFGWNDIRVTASVGIAHYPADGADGAAILAAADKALYRAKGAGRNRVVDSSQI